MLILVAFLPGGHGPVGLVVLPPMRAAIYGRIVFGASAALFGVIALMWHDVDTWQGLARIWKLPFGTVIGDILMVVQIAAAIAIMIPQAARYASIALGVVFAIFALDRIGGVILQPAAFPQYDAFAEVLSYLCGAVAVYSSTETNAAQAVTLARASRIALGLCTIPFTLAQIVFFKPTVDLVPAWIPPNQTFWAVLTTIAFGLAAIAMLVNFRAVLAMRLMALMIVLFGILVWIPILIAHPNSHNSWSEFAINFMIAGATWLVAEAQTVPETSAGRVAVEPS